MDKIGVIQDNIRRSRLFKQREQQLFQIIKKLWNTHHNNSGEKRFSENATLEITYKTPEFPIDPKTKKEDLLMEQKILDTEDKHTIKKMYPHYGEPEISRLIKKRRKDKEDKQDFETEIQIKKAKELEKAGIGSIDKSSSISSGGVSKQSSTSMSLNSDKDVTKPKIDNRAKHSEESSKQPKDYNKDPRTKDNE
jgi:hypothetical protein